MTIGKYTFIIRKENWYKLYKFFFMMVVVSYLFKMGNVNEIFRNAFTFSIMMFLIEISFENYYRNNLHKRKKNWFWSGFRNEMLNL